MSTGIIVYNNQLEKYFVNELEVVEMNTALLNDKVLITKEGIIEKICVKQKEKGDQKFDAKELFASDLYKKLKIVEEDYFFERASSPKGVYNRKKKKIKENVISILDGRKDLADILEGITDSSFGVNLSEMMSILAKSLMVFQPMIGIAFATK